MRRHALLLLACAALLVAPAMARAGGLTVLGYHRIGDNGRYSTAADTFEKQMELLQDEGFVFLHPGEVASYFQTGTPFPERSVLLTFDDGHKSAKDILPYLKNHEIPALFFPYTKAIKDSYPNALTRRELRGISREALFMVGSHTHNHHSLIDESDTAVRRNIKRAERYIELNNGLDHRTSSYLSLPYGQYNQSVLDTLSNHYNQPLVFSTTSNVLLSSDDPPYGRLMVNSLTDMDEFKRRVRQKRLRLEHISIIDGSTLRLPPYYVYFELQQPRDAFRTMTVFLNGRLLDDPELVHADQGVYRVHLPGHLTKEWNQLMVKGFDKNEQSYRVRTIGFAMP